VASASFVFILFRRIGIKENKFSSSENQIINIFVEEIIIIEDKITINNIN